MRRPAILDGRGGGAAADAGTNLASEDPPRQGRHRLFPRRPPSTPESSVVWEHGDALATRVIHLALVAAILTGPTSLVLAIALGSRPAASPANVAPEATSDVRDASLAGAAAQRVVVAWLTAAVDDRSSLQALIVDDLPATLDLPDKRPAGPTQVWVGEIDQRAPGRYRVVVATLGGALGSGYFAVPVRVQDGRAAAVGLPARSRPPALADAQGVRLPATDPVTTDDPAYQTAAGYITAYLTGSAEIDRWTAPGTPLTAITPPSCGSVRIDRVQTVNTEAPTTRAAVVTTATCQAAGRPPSTTQYGLLLQMRDGRWEVVDEDPALLQDPNLAPPANASPSTSGNTTTPR